MGANRLVHIPGWGDFQVEKIATAMEPIRLGKNQKGDQEMQEAGGRIVAEADEFRQELDCENVPDPNRVVVKRTVLSGHPFHVNKRVCTVRFMFFNREDVDWFKPVELRTKTGRRGHIKDGLGTHGHMKCIFDGQVSQQDAVLMNLFKRVFPKWTYDPFVADYNQSANTSMKRAVSQDEMEME